ncbi:MAG: dihydrofolate reductase [Frankiales bacterium]|nr:dihydrofolate reductase [Frankiales bacterium]
MGRVTAHVSISLDGFLAGPDQSEDTPLGVGGMQLHHWHFGEPTEPADIAATQDLLKQRGAYVMGRNMFGPVRGEWDRDWRGWWGDEPPYHAPVFVLTHHARDSVEMQGGTTFHFVTDGFEAALTRAREVAGDLDIGIAGGASTIRQAMAAGALEQLTLDVAPVLLGRGERLFDGVAALRLELVDATHSPNATHITYRVLPN